MMLVWERLSELLYMMRLLPTSQISIYTSCPCSRCPLQPGCQQWPWEWRTEKGTEYLHLFTFLSNLLCLSTPLLSHLFLTKTQVISIYANCFLGTTKHKMINTVHFREKNHISTSINYPFSGPLFASIRAHQILGLEIPIMFHTPYSSSPCKSTGLGNLIHFHPEPLL